MLKTFTDTKNSKLKENKSNFSKAIRFDEIHTNEKQTNLDRMMQLVNKDIKSIKNKVDGSTSKNQFLTKNFPLEY